MRRTHRSICKHRGKCVGVVKIACASNPNTSRYRKAFECPLKGRCIPKFKGPWTADQKEVEGKLYTLCNAKKGGCPDYET